MIKAIILDVDGVIVGEKIGFNAPNPHEDVLRRLKEIRKKGVFISLCTAKPHYSVEKIIVEAKLDNLHITNGGGVIIDPLDNVVLKKHVIDKNHTKEIINSLLNNQVYSEFYTVEEYFIQKNQISDITNTHELILQRKAHIVESLVNEVEKQEIVKIMPISENENDSERIKTIFEPYNDNLTLSWGIHPVALPHQFGIITAKGISKAQAVQEIADSEHIDKSEMLGIGDSASDWQYIQNCGFAGTVENANSELKDLFMSKGKSKFYIGKSVDENGILDIFNFYGL